MGGDLSREWVAGQCQCAARGNGAPTERTPVTSPHSVPSTVDNHRACESMACRRHAFVHCDAVRDRRREDLLS